MSMMKGESIAIFNSNDIYPVSADTELPFEQHRDIFYLSGIDQEETILILFPNAKDKKSKEILFIRKSDEHTKIWEGDKLSKDKAKKFLVLIIYTGWNILKTSCIKFLWSVIDSILIKMSIIELK